MHYTKRPGIYGFTGPHRYLSNFWVEQDGSSVELRYQMAKCAEAHQRKYFDGLNPREAKAMGQRVKIRTDWEAVKVDIMLFHVTRKFKDPLLAHALKITGCGIGGSPAEVIRLNPDIWVNVQLPSLHLEETNSRGDTFWGVCNGRGLNMLGQILMQVRGELL